MARPTSTAATTSNAPKKTAFRDLIKKLRASKRKAADEGKSQTEMIQACENAHPGVSQKIAALDKMDAVARDEWLFQFDVARDHMEWEKRTPSLGLVRGETGDDEQSDETQASADSEPDLRPKFLRQPGASVEAAENVTKLHPDRKSVKDAADAAEAALSQVGRGPTKTDPKTQH